MSTFFSFFLSLSLGLQLTFIGLFFLVIFFTIYILIAKRNVIVQFGHLIFKFGKKKYNRSCTDCVKIFSGISDKWRSKRRNIIESVLKEQMTYAEIVLDLIVLTYYRSFRQLQIDLQPNLNKRANDYLVYKNVLKVSFMEIKDEIRRSIKENGFCSMNPDDFEDYKSKMANKLFNIHTDYIIDNYPDELIPDVQHVTEIEDRVIINKIKDIYDRAKEIALDKKEEIIKMDTEYDAEMDSYIYGKKE